MNILDRLDQQQKQPVSFKFANGDVFAAEVAIVDAAHLRALLDVARAAEGFCSENGDGNLWDALAPLLEETQ